MDLVNRLIAWAAYVTGAVLIGSCAFFTFHYYRQNGAPSEIAAVKSQPGGEANSPSAMDSEAAERVPPPEQMNLQRAQIRRLQTLLEQKTKLLQQKTALLDQKNAEHEALRAELDDAIELLGPLAAEVAGSTSATPGSRTANEQWKAELEKLREESEKGRMLADQQQAELNRLKEELGVTDQGISQLQQQAEAEFDALAADKRVLEAVVSETLVRIGVDAVPALVYQLANPRADVRKWAAMMLGELGTTGRDAIPPLQEALKDKDPTVSEAARLALEKLDPSPR